MSREAIVVCFGLLVAAACTQPADMQADAGEAPLGPLSVKKTADYLVVFDGPSPLLQYRYDGIRYKPYVKELFTPSGVQILRDAPADHLHHRGLMFAIAAEGVSFWTEREDCGRQVQRAVGESQVTTADGVSRAVLTQELDWIVPTSDRPALTEHREIDVYKSKDLPATLVTWRTQLTPASGRESVELTGSHYYGLGMRFLQSLDKVGRFVNSAGTEGEVVRGQERLTPASWSAYVVPDDRLPVTAAVFDHPKNARHPAVMFTMPEHFAYQSATLNLWREPMTLKAGQPLTLVYGVALWDGEIDAAAIEQVYQRWLTLTALP